MNALMHAIALIAILSFPAAVAAEPALHERIVAKQGWVAYRVPMVADAGEPCCLDWNGGKAKKAGCDLDGKHWNFGHDSRHPSPAASATLAVYAHVQDRVVDEIKGVSATCPVTSATPIHWIDPVASKDSVSFLAGWLQGRAVAGHIEGSGLAALAYHAEPAATRALSSMSTEPRPRKLREESLFWLGQARGLEGALLVEQAATRDTDPKIRAHAVFALSQSRASDPYARIRQIARRDSTPHVRSQALFWMAQTGDVRARADITSTLRDDVSAEVREQAVFALSQLKDGDKALIALLRGDHPRAVKERALFWLGQSGSNLATDYFDEVLTRAEPAR